MYYLVSILTSDIQNSGEILRNEQVSFDFNYVLILFFSCFIGDTW